jgi:site-specific recombinase
MRTLAAVLLSFALSVPALAVDRTVEERAEIAAIALDDADAWTDIVRGRLAELRQERKVASRSVETAQSLVAAAELTGDAAARVQALDRADAAMARLQRTDDDLAAAERELTWATAQRELARAEAKEASLALRHDVLVRHDDKRATATATALAQAVRRTEAARAKVASLQG